MIEKHEPDFSVDWFSHNIPVWNQVFEHFKLIGKDNLRFLEIGCFEGRATRYMLESILTGTDSKIDVVDTFGGSLNEGGMGIAMSDYAFNELYNKFVGNIEPYKERVTIHRGLSGDVLKQGFDKESYDFIYVDGSHTAYDVLQDAVLAHSLLKVGGIMIFDDFGWKDNNNLHPTNSPELGVVAFLNAYELHYNVVFQGYQLGVVKVK
jgi:SAM-dependent methyltransferase